MPSDYPRQRFQDILDNIASIETYTAGMTEASYAADPKTRDAVERCLARISEAAVKLGSRAEELAPGEQWLQIRRFGNILRHAYDIIDEKMIWAIVTDRLPALKAHCEKAIIKLDAGGSS